MSGVSAPQPPPRRPRKKPRVAQKNINDHVQQYLTSMGLSANVELVENTASHGNVSENAAPPQQQVVEHHTLPAPTNMGAPMKPIDDGDDLLTLVGGEQVVLPSMPSLGPLSREGGRKRGRPSAPPPDFVPLSMVIPDPIVLNDYWTMMPVPSAKLFRDILKLDPPADAPLLNSTSAPILTSQGGGAAHPPTLNLIGSFARLADEEYIVSGTSGEFSEEESAKKQAHLLAEAKEAYFRIRAEEKAAEPLRLQQRRENERKADVFQYIQGHVHKVFQNVNKTQRHVMEVEFDRCLESVNLLTSIGPGGHGGQGEEHQSSDHLEGTTDKEELMKVVREKTVKTMELIKEASKLKDILASKNAEMKSVMKPLRRHLSLSKHSYHRSGHFTKEKRTERAQHARPYNKTGKHIHDYKNPRFAEQRDAQIESRAQQLGKGHSSSFQDSSRPLKPPFYR